MTRETWASRFGFIMATAGFAVGLGNIWRFPYMTGQNGGGAFLVVYLAFAFLIGIPLLTADLGRKAQRTPIAVSLGDVSTLGKFLITGHGAPELLDFLYPIPISKIRPGRSRYALLLDERGYVLDDGLVCLLAPTADPSSMCP